MGYRLTPESVIEAASRLIRQNTTSDDALYILIVDCETHRFTVEGPMPQDQVAPWEAEAHRALAAGRSIVCIAIAGAQSQDVFSLGGELGCESWPPNTIIAPLDTVDTPLYLKKTPPAARDAPRPKR
jgi:hypothetical protein